MTLLSPYSSRVQSLGDVAQPLACLRDFAVPIFKPGSVPKMKVGSPVIPADRAAHRPFSHNQAVTILLNPS